MTVQRRRTRRPRTPAQLANDARLAARHQKTAEGADASGAEEVKAAPSVERPEMRPEMRAAPMRLSRELAEARAREIFEGTDLDAEEDKFALPAGLEPDGWEYEWKTHEVIGKRNPGNEVNLARMGWEPVDTSRHPEMMPTGYTGAITREGMILMQRPKIVNDRQRRRAYEKAVGQLRGQEQQVGIAPPDTMQRHDSGGRSVSKISHEYVSPGALKDEGFVPVSHRGGPVPIPE